MFFKQGLYSNISILPSTVRVNPNIVFIKQEIETSLSLYLDTS